MSRIVVITALVLLSAGCSYPDENLEGVVFTLEVPASSITEVVTPAFPQLGATVTGATITVPGPDGPITASSGSDGRFKLSIPGGPISEKGHLFDVKVEAPGYVAAKGWYLALPGRESQYVLVILRKKA